MSKASEFRTKAGQLTKEVQISDRLTVTLCKFDKLSMAMHGEELPLTLLQKFRLPPEERARYFKRNPGEMFSGIGIFLRWGVLDPRVVITDVEGKYGKRPGELTEEEIALNELDDAEQQALMNAIYAFNGVGDIEQIQQEASGFFRVDEARETVGRGDAAPDGEVLRPTAVDDPETGHA